jgi:hypothetical protein
MDLDRLMIEWHEQEFEGYLFDTPSGKIAADIRKKAKKRQRKYRLINFAGVALAVIIATLAVVAINLEHSILVRAATLVLMAINFFELLWMLKQRADEYKKPGFLPAKDSLILDRESTLKQIRQIKWQILLIGMASLGGLVYLALDIIWNITTGETILNFLIGFSTPILLWHFASLLEARSDLPGQLKNIERELKKLIEIGTRTSSSQDMP